MGIENIVESERRICVVQHSSIPLTSIEFMRNITIGNNSNIGLMIMRIVQWNTVELRVLT